MLSQSGIICTQYNYLEAARSIIAKELSAMDVKLYLDSVWDGYHLIMDNAQLYVGFGLTDYPESHEHGS